MIVELQISSEKFFSLIRETLKSQPICAMIPPIDFRGEQLRMDWIEVGRTEFEIPGGDGTVIVSLLTEPLRSHRETVRVPQFYLLQPVHVHFTTLRALQRTTHGEAPEPPSTEPWPAMLTFNLRFSVGVFVISGQATLIINFLRIDPALTSAISADDLQQMQTTVRANISSRLRTYTIDLGDAAPLLGSSTLRNAGLTINVSQSSIAIGLEFGTALTRTELQASSRVRAQAFATDEETLAFWRSFYQTGGTPGLLTSNNWALSVDRRLLLGAFERLLSQGLEGHAEFRVNDDDRPRARWIPETQQIIVHFGGRVDAPGCPLPIHVGVDITISFSITSDNRLHMNVRADWGTNIINLAACALTWVLFPVLGFLVAVSPRLNLPWWQALLAGVFNLVFPFAAPFVGAALYRPSFPSPGFDCRPVERTDNQWECNVPIRIGGGGLPLLELRSSRGTVAGLVLSGRIQDPPTLIPARPSDVFARESELTWSVPGSCLQVTDVRAGTTVYISNRGQERLWICNVTSLAPLYQTYIRFSSVALSSFPSYITVDVPYSVIEQAYRDSASGTIPACDLIVQTTAGTRFVRIAAPSRLTEEERERYLRARTVDCEIQASDFGARPLDLIRPIPDPRLASESLFASLWITTLTGMQRGDVLQIRDLQEKILGSAEANSFGIAVLTALISPEPYGKEAQLLRITGSQSPLDQKDKQLPSVKQELKLGLEHFDMIEYARLHLENSYIDHHLADLEGLPNLLVTTPAGVEIFDVSSPEQPKWMNRIEIEGPRGALGWRDNLFIWGSKGLVLFNSYEMQLLIPETIIGVAHGDKHLFVLTEKGVQILDQQLKLMGEIPDAKGKYIAGVGDMIVLATDSQARGFQMEQGEPKSLGLLEIAKPTGLISMLPFTSELSVYVRAQKGFVLDVDNNGLRKASEYESAWFAHATRLREMIVVWSSEKNELSLLGLLHES